MAWRVAKCLDQLLKQINARYPGRNKASDGSIGNAEHSTRTSDHNPTSAGIVCARDFTNDPVHGLDSERVAQALLDSRDPRIKYIISNKKIASGSGQKEKAWVWRKYTGVNPHNHHFHISVKNSATLYDDVSPWNLDGAPKAAEVKASPVAETYVAPPPSLKKGVRDPQSVTKLQGALNRSGFKLQVDGKFGEVTRNAVMTFQTRNRIAADGICGPQTWSKLKM